VGLAVDVVHVGVADFLHLDNGGEIKLGLFNSLIIRSRRCLPQGTEVIVHAEYRLRMDF
jgi:hypothetical protein